MGKYGITVRCMAAYTPKGGWIVEVTGIPEEASPREVIRALRRFLIIGSCSVSWQFISQPNPPVFALHKDLLTEAPNG